MLSCVLDTALTTPAIVYLCICGEMSLPEVTVHVGCPEIHPRDFFMLIANIIYFLVYEFAMCLLF